MARIAIDGRVIKPWKTGLGRYGFALLQHVAAIDRDNEYLLLKSPLLKDRRLVPQENFREIAVPGSPEDIPNYVCGLSVLDHERIDVFHSLFHFLPRRVRSKRLMITCHDLIWIHEPWLSHPNFWKGLGIRMWSGLTISHAVQKSDSIICISDATKKAVTDYYGQPEKLHRIYHGAEQVWHTPSAPDHALAPLPAQPYFVMLGHTRPYKNAPGALRAMARLIHDHPECHLVFVGRGDKYKSLQRQVVELGLHQHVTFSLQVSDASLQHWLANAVALLQPSLIEGFGMPVIEAQQIGCPVIASDRASLPELVGNAGLVVNPDDPEAMAAAMASLLRDPSLRQQCIDRGYMHAAQFRWQATAEQTLNVYRSLM